MSSAIGGLPGQFILGLGALAPLSSSEHALLNAQDNCPPHSTGSPHVDALLTDLNERFAKDDGLCFFAGPGGLPSVRIACEHGVGEATLRGAHVTSWVPTGHVPVLWTSATAVYEPDVPVHGGVPLCWPWFGQHASEASHPIHGFAKMYAFDVAHTYALAGGGYGIKLILRDLPEMRNQWPGSFELTVAIEMGAGLHVELTTHNTSGAPARYGAALHSYLHVGDSKQLRIDGVTGCDYLDKLSEFARTTQDEAVRIDGEVDRVYLAAVDTCVAHDPVLARRIVVEKAGSATTVIWNPGPKKAAAMEHFADDGYRNLVCIEAANVFDDQFDLPGGGRHTLATTIRAEHL